MRVEDFINVNGLGKFQKSDDGTFMTFEPSNFVVCGHKVDKLKIKYNRDACLMHVYLMGTALMKLGEELNKGSFNVCEMGFKYIVQGYSDSEVTIYSIDPDSHVYDMEYQTGRSWNDLLGW